jgi:DNA-directed RNA polymerase specialized sigma24 family protein
MPHETEDVVPAHLDAALNYAWLLTESDADVEDVVKDTYNRWHNSRPSSMKAMGQRSGWSGSLAAK